MQQQYVDVTQLYVAISCSNHDIAISRLDECLSDLYIWFGHNGLDLNPDKTNSIVYLASLNIAGTSVSFSKNIKILGVVLDSKLSFKSQYLQP